MFSLTVMNRIGPTSKSATSCVDLAPCLVLYVDKSAEICVPLIFGDFSFISKVFIHIL